MKRGMKKVMVAAAIVGLFSLSACDAGEISQVASQTSVSTSATSLQTTEGTWDTTNPPTAAETGTQNSEPTVVEAETSNPQEINLSDSDSTEITAGGAYKLVGETTGSVTVTAPDSTVTLILDGASIGGGITVTMVMWLSFRKG